MPALSVIIPTYNTSAMTVQCCLAAMAAVAPGTELIVVDDGSTDGTAGRIAAECPQATVVRRDVNGGYARAVNTGLATARGDIVLLLNSDAVIDAASAGALIEAFERDPRLGVAGAQLIDQWGTPQWSGGRLPTLAWMVGVVSGLGHLSRLVRRADAPRRGVDEVGWVSGAAMAIRRSVLNATGPLSERYRFYCQDLELCTRAREAGWSVALVGNARVAHVTGATIAHPPGLPYDPGCLWPDLHTWGRLHYGRAWSVLARSVLTSVAWGRVAARAVRVPRRDDPMRTALVAAAAMLWRAEPS